MTAREPFCGIVIKVIGVPRRNPHNPSHSVLPNAIHGQKNFKASNRLFS